MPMHACLLQEQLSYAQAQLRGPAPGSKDDPALVAANQQLLKAQERVAEVERQLHRERTELRKMKNAERTVVSVGLCSLCTFLRGPRKGPGSHQLVQWHMRVCVCARMCV